MAKSKYAEKQARKRAQKAGDGGTETEKPTTMIAPRPMAGNAVLPADIPGGSIRAFSISARGGNAKSPTRYYVVTVYPATILEGKGIVVCDMTMSFGKIPNHIKYPRRAPRGVMWPMLKNQPDPDQLAEWLQDPRLDENDIVNRLKAEYREHIPDWRKAPEDEARYYAPGEGRNQQEQQEQAAEAPEAEAAA